MWKAYDIPSETKIQKARLLAHGPNIVAYKETEGWKIYDVVKVKEKEEDSTLSSERISTFPINVVRQCYEDEKDDDIKDTMEESKVAKSRKQRERTHRMSIQAQTKMCFEGLSHLQTHTDDDQEFLQKSEMLEVQAVLETGCSAILDSSATWGQRLYGWRFIVLIKPDDSKRFYLYVAGCHDNNHGLFTSLLTIKKLSTRLLLALLDVQKWNLHTRDVTKKLSCWPKLTCEDLLSC